jgi:hypothetical protein
MKLTKSFVLCITIIGSFALLPVSRAADAKDQGEWHTLFNGKDLSGWVPMNEVAFTATNGIIHMAKGAGWLRTERQYTNCVFEAEWRALETNYNSGFYLRARLDGKPFPTDGWQVNLKANALGSLVKGSTTVLPTSTAMRPLNQWFKFRMEVRGRKLTLDADGQRVWEFNEIDADHGYLGLQSEGMAFDFRNLRVQELPPL